MIYHIAHKKDWRRTVTDKSYKPKTYDQEGFIHCSPVEKILQVANNFYKGQSDLLLLCIDESKVKSKIVWEDLYDHNFDFPHVYGELNSDAVVSVIDFRCNADGVFTLPENMK